MTFQNFSTMLIYMLVSSFTPGPGNILALNTMVNFGWKKGKRLLFGIAAGYLTVQYICTFAVYGLSRYLTSALSVLKYVGAIYMVWLAVHIMLSKKEDSSKDASASFKTGFLMQLVNVKIYFYITTLLSAYIVPAFPKLWQMLLMGLFVVSVGSSAAFTWAFLGLKLQNAYMKHFRKTNIVLGLFLMYCAINIIRS